MSGQQPILVWDLPTRLFHWLFAGSFAGAWLTSESEGLAPLHVALGYTLMALVAFRLVWGLAGSRHARFASFMSGPAAALRYLQSLRAGTPEHHAGHNPAGALAIAALLLLGAMTAGVGLALQVGLGGEGLEHLLKETHEALASLMLGVVGVHLAGVALGSIAHRENLVRTMVTGRRLGRAADAIRSARPMSAFVLLAAVVGLWAWLWVSPPAVREHERHGHHARKASKVTAENGEARLLARLGRGHHRDHD